MKVLKGKVLGIERTGDTLRRDDGTWEKCIFKLEITRFSRRTPSESVPPHLKGKVVSLVEYCLHDWHYALGFEKSLGPEETENLLQGKKSSIVFW